MKKFLLILAALSALMSCGKSSIEEAAPAKTVLQVFTKGDPDALIEGTKGNDTSFITPANMLEFNNYVRSSAYFFSEKEFYKETSQEHSIEEGNEPKSEKENLIPVATYSFKQLEDGRFLYEDSSNNVSFIFSATSKTSLDVTAIIDNLGVEFPVTVEHYSISPDKTKMSFLLTLEDAKYGKVLVRATFFKLKDSAQKEPKKIDDKYNYLLGPGVSTAWELSSEGSVKIDVCPSVTKNLPKDLITIYIKEWEKPFVDAHKKFSIQVNYPKTCAPFSDVNQQSIHWVKEYLTVPSISRRNTGVTLSEINSNTGEILSSHIFLWGSEINKLKYFGASNFDIALETLITINHEMGHFLGLHHNFKDQKSIMSYAKNYELNNYDYEAIFYLYRDQVKDLPVATPTVN